LRLACLRVACSVAWGGLKLTPMRATPGGWPALRNVGGLPAVGTAFSYRFWGRIPPGPI